MTVVLIGDASYREFELLAAAVEDRDEEAVVWDTRDWPGDAPVTFDLGSETVTVDDEFHVEDVSAVFPWPHQLFEVLQSRFADELSEKGAWHTFVKLDQWRGVFSSLLALFDRHGATVFYPPWTHHYHDSKPLQVAQLANAGVNVPETVFTTDPDRARAFVEEHGEVVYKPVAEGARPSRLSVEDLEQAPLERLSSAPVQFQAYVPGDDVRVFFLDGEVRGASRYVTDDWTIKSDVPTEDAEPVDLREPVRRDVERAAEVSPLSFGAADVRLSPDDHAVLEVNPGPRFAFHDLAGATEIADVLAARLVE